MKTIPRWLLAAFALIGLVLLAAVASAYASHQQRVRDNTTNLLRLTAQDKADALAKWRAERLADADCLLRGARLEDILRGLGGPAGAPAQDDGILREALRGYPYDDVMLADAGGLIRASLSGRTGPLEAEAVAALAEAAASRQPALTDLHAPPGDTPSHVDVVAPLFDGQRLAGALVLKANAEHWLDPLLAPWPAAGRSGQAYLVRRDGQDALVLSPLRGRPGAALTLRVPVTQPESPAAMAARGMEGAVEGVNEGGTAVLAGLDRVTGSPWTVVAAIDRSEGLAAWQADTLIAVALVAVSLAAAMAAAGLVWQHSAKAHYRALYQAEATLRASQAYFGATLMSIGDGVIAADAAGRVTLMNPVAEALTGWPEAEARGRPLAEVFRVIDERTRQPAEDVAARILSEARAFKPGCPAVLVDRSGAERPIAYSGAPLRDAAGANLGAVVAFHDQAEERAATAAVRASEERLALALDGTTDGWWDWNLAANEMYYSPRWWEMLGYTDGELPADADLWRGLLHPDDADIVNQLVAVALHGKASTYQGEFRLRHKDGRYVPVLARCSVVRDAQGTPLRVSGANTDLTERKRAEEAQRKRERDFANLVDNAPDLIVRFDTQLRHVYGNRAAAMETGFPMEATLGKRPGELPIPPENAAFMERSLQQALDSGADLRVEQVFPTPDGPQHYETHIVPERDAGGRIESLLAISRNVTDRRRAEEALRASLERYRLLLQNANDAIYVHAITPEAPGAFLDANDQACRMLGYSREELLALAVSDIDVPEQAARLPPIIRELYAKGRAMFQTEHLAKDGRRVPVEVSTRLFDLDGQPTVLSVVRDITERRQAEAVLHEQQANLTALIENTDGSIWSVDAQHGLLVGNSVFHRNTSAVLGRRLARGESVLQDSLPREALEEWRGYYDRALRGEKFGVEVRTRFRAEPRWIDYRFSPILDAEGRTMGVTVLGRDVTARRQVEDEVRRLNETLEQRVAERTAQLEQANQEMEAFTYSVSHDLRAPLRAIDGFARILNEEYAVHMDAEGRRYCGVISANARRMGQLIDDLLALSRLSRAEMGRQRVDMRALANGVFQELAPPEERGRIEFELGVLPAAAGDPLLIRQVWMNLLSNAIKYSARRERAVIQVTGELRDGEAVYAVRDNGAGFDMRYAHKLFGVFQRLHAAREYEGTGVGLAIVQRLVRRHGGRVWAEGVPDGGATFSFTLPAWV